MLAIDDRALEKALETSIARNERLVVAFSGGADSALLAYFATKVLGRERVLCATAISASLATDERHDCAALVSEWDLRHLFVETDELARTSYVANDLNRCFHCKDALMDVLTPLASSEDAAVALGVNVDDLGDHRPGQAAAKHKGAVFPLVEAGLTKDAVRSLSRQLGLRTWDKPAMACLASRTPHGVPVTIAVLSQIDRAEAALRRLGFHTLRVRHYGNCARLEVPVDDFAGAPGRRPQIVDALHGAGYEYVTLDLEGMRSGNLARSALGKLANDTATNGGHQ